MKNDTHCCVSMHISIYINEKCQKRCKNVRKRRNGDALLHHLFDDKYGNIDVIQGDGEEEQRLHSFAVFYRMEIAPMTQ